MKALERKLSPNNTKSRELALIATILGTIAPATAFAASGAAADDGSGLFVWIFLGFFALIIVGQLVPAFMLITGLVKGIASKTEVKSEDK